MFTIPASLTATFQVNRGDLLLIKHGSPLDPRLSRVRILGTNLTPKGPNPHVVVDLREEVRKVPSRLHTSGRKEKGIFEGRLP